jgi:two-component system KDP operon response regulator KdpE
VRLCVSYLRAKIEPDPAHPRYILTEKGLGCRFTDLRRVDAHRAG